MMRAVEEGRAEIGGVFVKHLDECLGCLACQTACPSGVPYGHLLEAARVEVKRKYTRPVADRTLRRLILSLFPYPARLGPVVALLSWYQRLGISDAMRGSGVLGVLSPHLAQMEALLPPIPSRAAPSTLPEVTPCPGRRIGRIGLLVGCVQRFLLPEINQATARVLAASGYEAVVPQDQGCCGALHLHSGDMEIGRLLATKMIETFERARVDLVVADAAGCGAAMKEYGHLFRDDAGWRSRAQAFSAKVRDVSEILSDVTWNGKLNSLPLTVAYFDACHLAHGQGIRKEPRTLLQQIPEITLVELPESDLCCGSAGIYNLLQPKMSSELLQRKVERIRDAGVGHVAIGNIGCLLQVTLGLRQSKLPVRAVHPVELLDWSLHGMPGEAPSAESRRELEPWTLDFGHWTSNLEP
jgi:glycolate oxidase iron-sulfur subunit